METIVLSGVLDQYAAEEFVPRALPWLQMKGDAVLEMSGVERLHGAFLQVLVALKKDLQAQGRKVVLRGTNEMTRECFRVSGTQAFFQFADSESLTK